MRPLRAPLLAVCALAAILGAASKFYRGPGDEIAIGQFEDFFGTLFLILLPRALFLDIALSKIIAVVLFIVVGIELSQLVHGEVLERIRSTWLGAHILGTDFAIADLFAYGLAAAAAVGVDRSVARRTSPETKAALERSRS